MRSFWWLVMGAGVIVLSAVGSAMGQPLVTSSAWFTWYQALLTQRLNACPVQRGTTFYFSQAGSDANDGSTARPWRSLAKAQAVLDAHPQGQIALLFRRGDVWREDAGLDTAAPNITIADYGAGAKPLFTAFRTVAPSGWIPAPGLINTYYRVEPGFVSWVKEDDDLDRPYSRQASAEVVSANEGSWCWDASGYLYVHPRHTALGAASDPRFDGKSYEVVRPSLSGVLVRGGGTRVQNIRTQGWGMTEFPSSQRHGIDCRVAGSAQAVFVGCESHYGLAHVMTMFVEGAGGIATFVDCRAGLTTPNSGGAETMFNTYATHGGNQTIFHQCVATHGTLPGTGLTPGTRGGTAFYGHTDSMPGSVMGLTIVYGCVTRDTTHGSCCPSNFANLTPAGTLADVRTFIVNEVFEGGPTTGDGFQIGVRDAARVNGRYLRMRPPPLPAAALAGWAAGGWVINCTIEVDCSDQPINFALFNAAPGWPSSVQIWNSFIHATTPPGIDFRIDWDVPSQCTGSSMVNSVVSHAGGGSCYASIGDDGLIRGNAYSGVDPGSCSSDPAPVWLGGPPLMDAQPACASPLACRPGVLPGGIALEFEQRGFARFRNTIGPMQSNPCGNCDESTASPVFNVIDFQCFLNKFGAGDPGANCDGSTAPPTLNIADFQCFLGKFAAACR